MSHNHTYSRTTHVIGDDGQPQSREIPRPFAPVFPVLSWSGLLRALTPLKDSKPGTRNRLYTESGRQALLLALQQIGINPGDEVLLPAFHCEVMVDAVCQSGAKPVYFPITGDLQPELVTLEQLISPTTKAIVLVHFFGYPCRMQPVLDIARRKNIPVIEDCAHVQWGAEAVHGLGAKSDFAVWSLQKFYSGSDGGLLTGKDLSKASKHIGRAAAGWLRRIAGVLETSGRFHRLWPIGALTKSLLRLKNGDQNEEAPGSDADGTPAEIIRPRHMSRLNRFLTRAVDPVKAAHRRRQNYVMLADALKDTPGCRLLFPELPDDVIPYMVPVMIDNLSEIFPSIEDEALPLQRFGQFLYSGNDSEICGVSKGLSEKCIQIPCHGGLGRSELLKIARNLEKAVLTTNRSMGAQALTR